MSARSRTIAWVMLAALAGAGCGLLRSSRNEWNAEFCRGTNKAEAALSAGHEEEAAAAVAALQLPGDSSPPVQAGMLLRRAELHAAIKDSAGEEADVRSALALQPKSFDALMRLTQFLIERGRLAEALAAARTLTMVNGPVAPKNRAEKWLKRAETLVRLGRDDEALAEGERALAGESRDLPVLCSAHNEWSAEFMRGTKKAVAALSAGHEKEAFAAVAALQVRGDASPASQAGMLLRRAELHAALKDFVGEEADVRAALALQPKNFDALCRLTQFLRERGRLAESLAAAQILTKVNAGIEPKNRAEKWLQRAETFARLGRYEEALADGERALADDSRDLPSLWLVIDVLLSSNRPREALPYADRMLMASRTAPERARALSQRAAVHRALGEYRESDADAERAVAEDPSDHVALEAKFERMLTAGRMDDALGLADRMIFAARKAPPPVRALLYDERAQVKRRRGDAAGAEADLRAALAVEPDAARPLRALVELLLDEKRADEAAALMERLQAATAESSPDARAEISGLRARAEAARRPQEPAGPSR